MKAECGAGGAGEKEDGERRLMARSSPVVAHILCLRDADLSGMIVCVGEVIAGGLDAGC